MKTFSQSHLLLLAGRVFGRWILTKLAFGQNPGKIMELQLVKRIKGQHVFIILVVLLLVVQPFLVSQVSAQEKTVDAEKIERLERLIRAQQQQLESLQQQLNELKQTAADAKAEAEAARSAAEASKKRVDVISTAKAKNEVQASTEKVVTSAGGERSNFLRSTARMFTGYIAFTRSIGMLNPMSMTSAWYQSGKG